MNLKDLREVINNPDLDENILVVLSGDSEGNNYSELSDWGLMGFDADSGEVSSLGPDSIGLGEFIKSYTYPPALVLWPY